MTDEMSIEDYLAQGGVLTSPGNVPPRYRGEVLRIMASFIDSALAGSAGFADVINDAPGIAERISAARIVAEKAANAGKVLAVMAEFGADQGRYASHHPWSARLPREADLGAARMGGDMRLSVFHYPLRGWVDAVVMNVLMGRASAVQMDELCRVSYQPLAEVFRTVAPVEARHADLGEKGLERICATEEGRGLSRMALAYWQPRVAASFGAAGSGRFERLQAMGLRNRRNEDLLAAWQADIAPRLDAFGL
jgi:1,2-phenylacetyl-CoA epoxidase catalytic subunit